ncbi:MAG: hypothetical protein AB1831_04310 [Pseudomonadota bacterium]
MKRSALWPLLRATAAFALALLAACNTHGEPSGDTYHAPGRFRVTNEVVNPDLMPFAATISGFGNNLINEGSGFEPPVYRNKYIATENAPDRVVAPANVLSHYDTLREGFLDGAEVHVYRIENGRFRMVRRAHVAQGGFHVSGWLPLIGDSRVLAPDATRFSFRWANYNRPDVNYYFTVRAIDHGGRLSAPATPFAIMRPAKVVEGKVDNPTQAFKPSRLTLDDTPPPAPHNLRVKLEVDGSLTLSWDRVDARDLAGYIVYRSDYPPAAQRGYYFDLAETAASPDEHIRAGDMVVVSKKFYRASRNESMSNRVWGVWNEYRILLPGLLDFFSDESPRRQWELVPHEAGTPVEQPGETCLKLDLGLANKATLATYNHSGTAQSWYPVLEAKPYTVEFWMRANGRGGHARFMLTGYYHDSIPSVRPIDFQVGPTWRKYTATFTPPRVQESDRPNQMLLELSGPGTFYVDNFRVYRADLGYQEMPPEDYAALRASGMQALRTHGIVNTRFRTHDMAQLTNPPGVVGSGTQQLNTLPQLLGMMRKAGKRPWLQVEFHMSPEEWLGLIEYLAAPYDPASDTPEAKPWAYKRYQQGQTRPWTEEFDRIYSELSNETWNRLFYPWVFDAMTDTASGRKYSPGQVYGMYQEYVLSILRGSPYWQAADLDRKFRFVLGGWANQSYGRDAAAFSPSSDYLTIAAYNGGWDEGEGPPRLTPASFFNVLSQVNHAIPVGERHARELAELRQTGSHAVPGTYEAGPGYALNGLNNASVSKQQQAEQEQVMKSLAAGTATLDSFLARAYLGFRLQNFFTFDRGTHWKSHAKWYHGGQAYPAWKLLSLFNQQGVGDMLRTETLSAPRIDLPGFGRRQAVKDAPLAAVYATRRSDRYALVVVSRKIGGYPDARDDGYTPVSIELPFASARRVTLYRMAGDPTANNILADEVGIETVPLANIRIGRTFEINAATGADRRGLPPAATFLYVFEGIAGVKR